MKKVLQFVLGNDLDEKLTINVNRIKSSINQEDVKGVADIIATSSVFVGKKGIMTRVIAARIVETQYTEFEV